MKPEVCMICHDINRYKMSINNAQNILYHLQDICGNMDIKKDSKFYNIKQELAFERKHIHMMCGTCSKINERELKNIEDSIDENLTIFILNTQEKNENYYRVLRLLQGYYPIHYKIVEQEITKQLK